MKTAELANRLPDTVKIVAPLINGERFLRTLPFAAEGPYSQGYGYPLYALAKKDAVLDAHRRARGKTRVDIESLVQ